MDALQFLQNPWGILTDISNSKESADVFAIRSSCFEFMKQYEKVFADVMREHAVFQWAHQKFFPALSLVAERGYRDYSSLLQSDILCVFETPELRKGWEELVHTAEKESQEALDAPSAPPWRRFVEACWKMIAPKQHTPEKISFVKYMNEHLLSPKGLRIVPATQTHRTVGKVIRRQDAHSADGPIPTYFVHTENQLGPRAFANIYDCEVVINQGALEADIRENKMFVEQPYWAERQYMMQSDAYRQANKEYAQWIFAKYPDPSVQMEKFVERVLYEEWRHVIDWRRSRQNRCYQQEDAWETPSSPHSADMWEAVWTTERGTEADTPAFMTGIIIELSGQMTAAAVHDDPALVIREWARNLAKKTAGEAHLKPIPHDIAAELGTLLLAATYGLDGDMHKERFTSHDQCRAFLRHIAIQLAQEAEKNPQGMRLALKKIYSERYSFPIDEAPSPVITEDGGVQSRDVRS